MSRPNLRTLGALAIALAGCSSSAEFRPTENASKVTNEMRAAYYDLNIGGKRLGDVRVWSPGAHKVTIEGEKEKVVEVSLRLRNDTDQPWSLDLDRTYLELATEEHDFTSIQKPTKVTGDTTVPASGMTRIDLVFTLPGDVGPKDVHGFEFDWAVKSPFGDYTQSTPFTRQINESRYYWYPPYPYGWYDPFYHPFGPW
jgi:hypothetical protein